MTWIGFISITHAACMKRELSCEPVQSSFTPCKKWACYRGVSRKCYSINKLEHRRTTHTFQTKMHGMQQKKRLDRSVMIDQRYVYVQV